MLFKCAYCQSHVAPGERVCTRKRCRTLEEQRQTNLKCREFGMPPYYDQARPFPLPPPRGDP